jgi:hypothetical protein
MTVLLKASSNLTDRQKGTVVRTEIVTVAGDNSGIQSKGDVRRW